MAKRVAQFYIRPKVKYDLLLRARSTQNHGYIHPEDQKITVYKNQSDKQKVITLIHEIVHGIDFHNPEFPKKYFISEDQTEYLAQGLYEFFEANGLLDKLHGVLKCL